MNPSSTTKKRVTVITPLEQKIQLDLNSNSIFMPRYGTVSVASAIKNAGYETKLFCEMSGSKIDWDYVAKSDFVCFSIMSFNSHRAYELTKKVRKLTKAPIIYGGSHPTVLPEDSLNHCDYVVRNEGEEIIINLLAALESGKSLDNITGISYKKDGKIKHNPDHVFIKDLSFSADISLIQSYKTTSKLDAIKCVIRGKVPKHHLPVIQTTRGCPFSCEFCFGKIELGNKYRKRDISAILIEIKDIVNILGIKRMMVVDNEFCVDKKHTLKVLEAIHKEFNGTIRLWVFTRIETSKDQSFLKKMREFGVRRILLGVESLNDETLQLYNKGQNTEQIKAAVNRFHDNKLVVMAFFVFGSDADTLESIRASVNFCIENNIGAICLFCLYDFPFQTKTFGRKQCIEDHRFIHHDWRFFNSNFVIHYPKKIRPSVLQQEIIDGYDRYISAKNSQAKLKLIYRRWGIREIFKSMRKYIVLLEEFEKGLYDENDELMEDKLIERFPDFKPTSMLDI